MGKKWICGLCIVVTVAIFSNGCSKSSGPGGNPGTHDTLPSGAGGTPPPVDTAFASGADVSWITQMESSGIKFYDSVGVQQDLFTVLKGVGINSIRLRVWVNPSGGWCNTADVVAKALRAKAAGMKILIDFHYSDTWADPGHQAIPAAWTGDNLSQLADSVGAHTGSVLMALKNSGVIPTWVQVGNETNDGMLWPNGEATDSMANFAKLVNAGYNAVKAIDSTIKVVVHISNGYDNSLFEWVFDGLKSNGAHWDVIGMSLYPTSSTWSSYNTQCQANMNDMITRYGKPVMIAEVGMPWTDSTDCKSFISDLIGKVKGISNGNGLGVFYWEPESYNNWQGYSLGAFNNSGMPTVAMKAFE